MEEDAIYIQRPSRRRSLAFGLITVVSLGIVGGVWFYMMKNVIADAANSANFQAHEANQFIEDSNLVQSWDLNVSELFQGLDEIIQPLVAPAPEPKVDNQAALQAAATLIKEKMISLEGTSATSDLTP